MADDAELMERIGRGDAAAFAAMVDRHGRYLYGVAHALTSNAADAEDVVQETFAAILKSHYRGESAVRTWLVGILVRQAAMLRRKRNRRGPMVSLEAEPASPPQSSAIAASDARADLTAMLAILSPEHRQIIVLRELEQMSYEEMAAALGIPRGTVESRLHRAREELRRKFKGYLTKD